MSDDEQTAAEKELAAKNMRVAIICGLVALAFYVGFIMFYV